VILTQAEKVRESWYQSTDSVFLTVFAKGLSSTDIDVKFSPDALSAELRMPDKSTYRKEWKVHSPIVADASSFELTPYKLEVVLKKAGPGEWKTLVVERAPEAVVVRENVVVEKKPTYPSSARTGGKDWDGLHVEAKKDEDEEKQDGPQALQKLFQQIYSGGDENTRRAMVKSYQTSGGTVLSTNWGEVAKKDYETEREAPKGQEFRDWNKL